MFEHVFRKCDNSTKSALFKLRCTWNTVFTPSTLHALDMKIKQIDSAWPIVTPRTPSPVASTGASPTGSSSGSSSPDLSPRGTKRKCDSGENHNGPNPKKSTQADLPLETFKQVAQPPPSSQYPHQLHVCVVQPKLEVKEEPSSNSPKTKEDWLSYLRGLQQSGILPPVKPSPPPMDQSNSQKSRKRNRGQSRWEAMPVVPTPQVSLDDFNIHKLSVRHNSIVDALLTPRMDSCKHCGLRLDNSNGKSKEWKDHMDWHVRENLGINKPSGSKHQEWYPSSKTWLTPRATEEPKEQVASEVEESQPGVPSSGTKTKKCSVCRERFSEYYDDDEEIWRFKDTVKVNEKIVHTGCASDATR
ncbi:hypothetical protein GCK72_008927 [Caenorhabditis remanei]|uniref:Pcf11 C-terminal domain-containing protein n=1 Tax=Caenorhabditis remanei TaxID=31234 RepID=A0A6A5GYW7_CAERE|nr:hypothetical protein GCK72_008927 [Caenorhabditis remanei]KAF1760678.1 hypothetical protein GCK72_008927 [Caenorhabditis remanei]